MNSAGNDGIDDNCSTAVSLNALATPTIVCDNDFNILSINAVGVEALGFDPQNMHGKSIEDILTKTKDETGFDANTWPELKSPQQFQRSDGSTFWGVKSATRVDGKWIVQIFEVDALIKERDAYVRSTDIWSKAVEAAEHGIWIFDTDEEKHFYSEGWKRMRGFPANEKVEETEEEWLTRVHPDDRDRVRSYIHQHASGNTDLLAFEYREQRLDGRWIWISSRGRALNKGNDSGGVQYSGTDTDITQYKEVERTVEVLTRRLELALKTSGVGVWEINLTTGGFMCDRALAEMYGFPVHGDKEVPLDLWKNALHPDDAQDAQLKAFSAMESRARLESTFRIVKPDGTVRRIRTTGNYHVDSNGDPKFLGADRDVTEDWEREQAVREQSAQFEGAIENMPHGLAMFDSDNRLVVTNQLYADMYCLPTDMVQQGVHLLEIVSFAIEKGVFNNPEIMPTAHKILDSIPSRKNQDLIWRLADGRIINFTISLLESGGWVSVHKDITEQHQAKKRLAESEQRFRDFTNSASDWCWESDKDHRLTYVTDSFETSTGISTDGFLGRIMADLPAHEDDRPTWRAFFEPSQGEKYKQFKDSLVRIPQADDDDVLHFKVSGTPRYDKNGNFIGFRGTGSNVTAEEMHKKQLAQAEKLLKVRSEQLVEAQKIGKVGDWSYKLADEMVWWSPETYALMGQDPESFQPTYEAVIALYCDDDSALILKAQAEVLRTRSIRSVDVKARRADGSVGDFVVTSKTLVNEDGETIGFFGTIQDISERKQAEQQLKKLAYYDPLTGLANRVLFHRELDKVLAANTATPSNGALLLLDLDRFKEVNDSLGHATGDELLGKVSRLLARIVEDDHFLARLGGDEFAIVVPQSDGRKDIVELAHRVNSALSGSFKLERGDVIVGTSIGIAMIPGDGFNYTDLLRNADLALYEAKENGRGCFEFFHQGLKASAQHKIALAHDLRIAITQNKGLSVHYQPQIDLATGRVCGFEALMRWNHPELGMVSPSEFIPIAETSHLICDLGVWILRESAQQAKAWLDAGEPRRKISVNVSAAQIWHSDLVYDVTAILDETGLPPALLCLELTESLLADNGEGRVRNVLKDLCNLGVSLALDDFGTDYSSLGYLAQLPFHRLKIDRIFVSGAATSVRSKELLKGMVALGRGLNMEVVGEGAENQAELCLLKEIGCNIVQGFVHSQAVRADEAIAFAHRHEGTLSTENQRPSRSFGTKKSEYLSSRLGSQ
tara:strand:- start:112795 stop:116502 length:3708 start_codon:yes stop_codon:yes gene_type:complete